MGANAPRPFRHLLPSIAAKRELPTVFLTVILTRLDTKLPVFKCLQVPETIEWE